VVMDLGLVWCDVCMGIQCREDRDGKRCSRRARETRDERRLTTGKRSRPVDETRRTATDEHVREVYVED